MRSTVLMFVTILMSSPAFSGEIPSQQFWAEHIRGKSPDSILDSHEVVEMIAFTGRNGSKIAPRSAAIASVLMRTHGVSPLRGPLSLELLLKRAYLLAGRKLTNAEESKVKDLHKHITASYYRLNPPNTSGKMRMDITFGLKDMRALNNTILEQNTVEESLRRISETHGWTGDSEARSQMSFDLVKAAIDRSIPVIMDDGGQIFFCFGYTQIDGQANILLANPKEMPLQVGRMRFSKMDEESIDPFVVNARRNDTRELNGKFKEDYQIKSTKQIPTQGFVIEPFQKGKYTAYVLMNWKRSAAAHDAELRKLLQLPEPKPEKSEPLPAQPTNRDLWTHYVLGREETLTGPYSVVPSIVFPSGNHLNQQYAVLTSSVATQKGVAVGKFTLSLRKFYRGACKVMNDEFLLLEFDRRTKMASLIESIKKQYDARQRNIESTVEELEDPYLVAALRMKATMAPTEDIQKGLGVIERLHGWKALLETARGVLF